jgi:hypothetical protein
MHRGGHRQGGPAKFAILAVARHHLARLRDRRIIAIARAEHLHKPFDLIDMVILARVDEGGMGCLKGGHHCIGHVCFLG